MPDAGALPDREHPPMPIPDAFVTKFDARRPGRWCLRRLSVGSGQPADTRRSPGASRKRIVTGVTLFQRHHGESPAASFRRRHRSVTFSHEFSAGRSAGADDGSRPRPRGSLALPVNAPHPPRHGRSIQVRSLSKSSRKDCFRSTTSLAGDRRRHGHRRSRHLYVLGRRRYGFVKIRAGIDVPEPLVPSGGQAAPWSPRGWP